MEVGAARATASDESSIFFLGRRFFVGDLETPFDSESTSDSFMLDSSPLSPEARGRRNAAESETANGRGADKTLPPSIDFDSEFVGEPGEFPLRDEILLYTKAHLPEPCCTVSKRSVLVVI